jgi:hypothetical protein
MVDLMNAFFFHLTLKRAWIRFCLTFLFIGSVFSALTAEASQSLRGEGSDGTQGFTISDQHYHLDGVDPTRLDSVEFTISGRVAAGVVKVKLAEDGDWYQCELEGEGVHIRATCDTSQGGALTVAELTSFRVVAAER